MILIIIPLSTVGFISYEKLLDTVKQKVSISNLNAVSQIGSNLEFIIHDVHDMVLV
jgi:two-component system, sensor histidine kinase YesM